MALSPDRAPPAPRSQAYRCLAFLCSALFLGGPDSLWGTEPVHGQGAGEAATVQDAESATVQGVVLEHETGRPLEGALVALVPTEGAPGDRIAETTGPEGLFSLGELPPGLYNLRVTLLSYHDLQDTLRVFAESDLELTLPLSVSPVPLDPIVVVSSRQPVWPMRAFEARRQTTSGVFFTREDIRASGAYEFTDLLRRIPGARVIPTGGFGQRVEFRGGCRPDIWVDGVLTSSTADLNSFLRTRDLEGVEVYKGAELPMEFGSNLCGAIVAWTAPGGRSIGDDEEGGSFWKRAVFGVGALILAWLATH